MIWNEKKKKKERANNKLNIKNQYNIKYTIMYENK